jgi:anti-anti-sigma regulatory factor
MDPVIDPQAEKWLAYLLAIRGIPQVVRVRRGGDPMMRWSGVSVTTGLRLDNHSVGSALVVRPVGVLTADTSPWLRDELLKCAAEEPPVIVVDLDGVRVAEASVLTVFPTVSNHISKWPGVPLVLVSARQPLRTLLRTSSVHGFIPIYHCVTDALDAAPHRRHRKVQLACDPASVWLARRIVEQTCHDWGLSGIVTDAVLVASELTENMIRHAGSDGWLCLQLRGNLLTVAVADADPRPPLLRPRHERRDGGRGLVLVAELSRTWGTAPRLPGGKVVWAVLAIPQ